MLLRRIKERLLKRDMASGTKTNRVKEEEDGLIPTYIRSVLPFLSFHSLPRSSNLSAGWWHCAGEKANDEMHLFDDSMKTY
jgi:hypothetical protein